MDKCAVTPDSDVILKSYKLGVRNCGKFAKDKYTPSINGMIKPMVNARSVGNAKIGKYFLIAFSIILLPLS